MGRQAKAEGTPASGAKRRKSAARWGLACIGALTGLAASLWAPDAAAQQPTFYLDRLYMAGAPDDGIAVWRPQMAPETRFYGQLGLGFGLNPLRNENVYDRSIIYQNTPVSTQLITYLDAGVELLGKFGLQVSLPFIAVQTANLASPSTAALMDARFDLRFLAWHTNDNFFKIGVNGMVWVPSGDRYSFSSDTQATGGFMVSGELDFKKLFVIMNTGLHFRPARGLGDSTTDFSTSSEWRWGVGGYVPLRDGQVRLGLQVFGSTGITGDKFFKGSNTPIEWMADGRMYLGEKKQGWIGLGGGTRISAGYAPDFRGVLLAGYSFGIRDTDPPSPDRRFKSQRYADHGADTDKDGLPDDIDLCPTEPEDGKPPNTDDGCPALPDRDGDGIPDSSDKCPDEPEDFDKIDDLDGCPEDDADQDNIPDAEDACPKEPGEPSTDPAKNGCPQFIRRISGSSEIQILKQVQFATGSAVILPGSYPILDEVVRLLKVNPEIQHLAIEGHTDNRGSDELNEKLSNDRSHSVMKYLIDRGGIDAGRLSAKGFGPKVPIADNNTADGRQKNRRVEFHIRSRVGGEGTEGGGGGAAPP
ncbi:cell envelope biogenesis protein OmpA [Chondromyces crocatus]|uniref:Cell envelope biogenesis protein OmpA n=2 Tax=Chondromyces crocatus TaxID=52 RepID=A0A0K1EMS0_CHOCO|nr:cell envelope biogenesis protein OmpA [Chondromyces crocatus]